MFRKELLNLTIGILSVLVIASGVINSIAQFTPKEKRPFLRPAVLGMEFAGNEKDMANIVGEQPILSAEKPEETELRKAAKNSVYWDFGFIMCYSIMFLLLSLWLYCASIKGANYLAMAAIAFALLGAGFDIVENVRLLPLLSKAFMDNSQTSKEILEMRDAALLKWRFVFLSAGVLSLLFVRRQGIGKLPGILLATACLLGLAGAQMISSEIVTIAMMSLLSALFALILHTTFKRDEFLAIIRP